MKIEMGESLIYSWLRHEKQCQLAQTNWKASQFWGLDHYDELQTFLTEFDQYYQEKYQYNIFKNSSLEQLLKQAEIDAIGISFSESAQSIYAVDIAYHEAGLNYGDKEKTLSKIIQKCVRTALCLYGFFNIATGEIIFASPKINPAIEKELSPMFSDLTQRFRQVGLEFTAVLYCNETFFTEVMQPVLAKGANVADTSELFLRSIQMYQLFSGNSACTPQKTVKKQVIVAVPASQPTVLSHGDGKAIDRIPKWAVSPEQNNYRLIRAYFQLLAERGRVYRPELEVRCQDQLNHPDVYVRDFKGNFASMKTDKGKSHGKVFLDDGYNISIWSEVAAVLEKHRYLFIE
ncbi:hypothetical protein [Lacrimispora defluvii]|uniref:hypothetical protein n=1 Tax=Lacrimispora defluvii TaxID=2719233 RepID=UPI00162A3842|nr:hypothetical protein [Lacrimispora defluvii]